MPVKIHVKGDRKGDYELVAHSAQETRIHNHEVFDMFDAYGNVMYTVPIARIRLMQLNVDKTEGVPLFEGPNRKCSVVMEGNSSSPDEGGDLEIECDRVSTIRIYNEVMVDCSYRVNKGVGGDSWNREFLIPLANIRYIDYNRASSKQEISAPQEDSSRREVPVKKNEPEADQQVPRKAPRMKQ